MRLLSYGFLAVLAACTSMDDEDPTTTTPPSAEDYANAATSIGSSLAHDGGEVAAMRQAAALARDDDAAGFTDHGDGTFAGVIAGLDYRFAIGCQGAGVAPCGPDGKSANVDASWSGTLDLPTLSVDLQHDARWQLSRMAGSIAHVDGTGHMAYTTWAFGSTHSYSYDATYHVVVNDARAIDGDLQLAITGTHAGVGARRYAITAAVTFQPDDTALLVLDGTRRYQILLATGEVMSQAAAVTPQVAAAD